MIRRASLLACLLFLTLPVAAQESLVLTTSVTPTGPQITDYEVWSLYLGRREGIIVIVVEDNNFHRPSFVYADGSNAQGEPAPGTTIATDLMRALNKANLSTQSLQRRILNRLIADGKLVGTVEGTPE